MRSGGVELASSLGALAVRFWNVSLVILKVMLGCCLVNSLARSSVSGKPVSSAMVSCTLSLVRVVLTSVAVVAPGVLDPGAHPVKTTAVIEAMRPAAAAPRSRRLREVGDIQDSFVEGRDSLPETLC